MDDDIYLERLQEEDLSQVLELYKELVPVVQDYEKSKCIFEEIKDNPSYYIVVAKDGKRVVGTLTGIICNSIAFGGYSFMVLEYLVVDQEYRGRGIATKLFNELEDYARENECAYMMLVSSEKNTISHNLYKKLDYKDEVKGFRKGLIRYGH